MTTITAPLKWHGGKFYLANRILALAPPHVHYCEPYAGGLQVLLHKNPEGISEVVCDINQNLTRFWRTLQDPDAFDHFRRAVEAIPISRIEYRDADPTDPVGFFILARQSLAGRMNGFTGITKTRTRRGMNNEVSAWISAVDGLPAVHARLRRVLILDGEATDAIRSQDGPDTWHYCDPTYLVETRAAKAVYEHEMTNAQHGQLLLTLAKIKGKFALSGYRSKLYDAFAARLGWNRHDFQLANHAAGGVSKRTMIESVWCNY
jgi:DNA adenine methylase